MKQLILAALLVTSALHAAADTTRISITPSWPADCLQGDYDFINEMSEVAWTVYDKKGGLINCNFKSVTVYEILLY